MPVPVWSVSGSHVSVARLALEIEAQKGTDPTQPLPTIIKQVRDITARSRSSQEPAEISVTTHSTNASYNTGIQPSTSRRRTQEQGLQESIPLSPSRERSSKPARDLRFKKKLTVSHSPETPNSLVNGHANNNGGNSEPASTSISPIQHPQLPSPFRYTDYHLTREKHLHGCPPSPDAICPICNLRYTMSPITSTFLPLLSMLWPSNNEVGWHQYAHASHTYRFEDGRCICRDALQRPMEQDEHLL
jgi:hypothetical protein